MVGKAMGSQTTGPGKPLSGLRSRCRILSRSVILPLKGKSLDYRVISIKAGILSGGDHSYHQVQTVEVVGSGEILGRH